MSLYPRLEDLLKRQQRARGVVTFGNVEAEELAQLLAEYQRLHGQSQLPIHFLMVATKYSSVIVFALRWLSSERTFLLRRFLPSAFEAAKMRRNAAAAARAWGEFFPANSSGDVSGDVARPSGRVRAVRRRLTRGETA